jgi:hypothetical protein
MKPWTGFLLLTLAPAILFAEEPTPPEEFGKVVFQRDYSAAVKQAKADKKPLFVLFDEIPG